MRCPNCNAENPATAKFCVECGVAFRSLCPKCGAENPPRSKFCAECGLSLQSGPPVSQPKTIAPEFSSPPLSEKPPVDAHEVPEGERKTVTALFADIKGSMELLEDLDPEEARAIV